MELHSRRAYSLLILTLGITCGDPCLAQIQEERPQWDVVPHNQGNIQLTVSNYGAFGFIDLGGPGWSDPITGQDISGCIYPSNSDLHYLTGRLMVGGISGLDTLVTNSGNGEFNPDAAPYGECELFSIDVTQGYYSKDAYSNLDIVCEYYDTLVDSEFMRPDPYDGRPHRPLGLKVRQRSMAWSSENLDDFIIFDYELMNLGDRYLEALYVGLDMDGNPVYVPDIGTDQGTRIGLLGFLRNHPAPEGCGHYDEVNVAYTVNNDGSPVSGEWGIRSLRSAMGITVLRTPGEVEDLNYNWLTQWRPEGWEELQPMNWGPRLAYSPDDPFRSIGKRLGVAEGDANTYYLMSHKEFDYNQIETAIDHRFAGWLPPPEEKDEIADGGIVYFTLSFGPFDIGPGQTAHFTTAVVGGENVHHDPTGFERLFHPQDPWPFQNQLDFSNLAENTRWARWVYDNPGYDTDGDGYRGEFRMCDGDTIWYEGDGIPDFRADLPPPAPVVRVTPHPNKLVIRWNGCQTETHVDQFTQTRDFEGYRVYVGLDSRKTSLSLLASYDWENYNRLKFVQQPNGRFIWVNTDLPFTLDSLRSLYNNPQFEPLVFTRLNPLVVGDTLYRFEKQDFNQSDLSNFRGIHKVYPDARDPGTDTLLWEEDDLTYEHGVPLPKFYEYEYVYDNLLATVPYYVSVTAFDFGFAKGGIPAKESNILNNVIEAFAQVSADTVEVLQLDAYVYPNPYRADEDYLERGFENRDQSGMRSRARRVHFGNLPNVCKIRIYSLDGDLIRQLDHNFPNGGPNAMHESWDLITRNTQLAMPGLYYYVIESEGRTQIGKFVIIL